MATSRKCQPGCECKRHTNIKPCEPGCVCLKHVKSAEHRRNLSIAMTGKGAGSYIDRYGYRVLTRQQGHPLEVGRGEVKEHRSVLYSKIGPEPHECHHCGKSVEWRSPIRATDLCVDHLDDDKLNNDPSNLVPSCFSCNWNRSNPRMVNHGREV